MSLLARGSQAADSPWAESAERGPSLLWVPRVKRPGRVSGQRPDWDGAKPGPSAEPTTTESEAGSYSGL